jgi:hypothetical protein
LLAVKPLPLHRLMMWQYGYAKDAHFERRLVRVE